MGKKFALGPNSPWANWQNQTGNEQTRNTKAGVYRPSDGSGPAGGYAMGNPILTANTGFTEDNKGKRTGTGGGSVINQTIPKAELLAARPDMAKAVPDAVFKHWQYGQAKDIPKVTQATRSPRAAALSNNSRNWNAGISRHKQAAQNKATGEA